MSQRQDSNQTSAKRLYLILSVVVLTVLAFGAFGAVRSRADGVRFSWFGVVTETFASRTSPILNPPLAVFLVNSTGDLPDSDLSDGICSTGVNIGVPAVAECTLRAAIQQANNASNADMIHFSIPGVGVQTITPGSALPVISEPVTIDGYTQPGSSVNTLVVGNDAVINIQLNGAGLAADGLNISAGNCTVRGLAIFSFGGDGIDLNTNNTNTIVGNFIGTNAAGLTDLGNGGSGVEVTSASNTIGTSAVADRNIISGNQLEGVDLFVSAATLNSIAGNYIGTDRNGTADLGNSSNGVFVAGPTNTIGGSTGTPGQGAGNVISGNTLSGVRITTGGNTNTVAGNLIGLQANGTAARANDLEGVFISNGASSNTIGGTSDNLRNVISGNSTTSSPSTSSTDGVEINGTGTDSNKVQGNYIGTTSTGTLALGNRDGVKISNGAQSNLIGGDTSTPGLAPGNVISGNLSDGIEIANSASSNNTVAGNLISLQPGGVARLSNTGNGVVLNGAASNIIGGSTTMARNIITGGTASDSDGIDIQDTASDNNLVAGNYIGTDINGTADFGAGGDGVRLSGSGPDNNTIGGSTSSPGTPPGNVISGHASDGIEMTASTLSTTNNVVQGNLIGLQANGTTALANAGNGVLLSASGSGSTTGNTVGGAATDDGNIIASNTLDGVSVAAGTGNTIRRNSIHSNGDHGIDLAPDGVTPNDNQDPDTGANQLQNFPIITSANFNTQVIVGRLNSTPGQTFTIDFYKNPTCDGTNGEGKTHIGSLVTSTTDSNGDVTFTFNSPTSPFTASDVITATATDSAGNTSEFSECATPTAVRLESFAALNHADGVELSWESGFEVNNLGYHIYREQNGKRSRVTPSIVAGSALAVGPGSRLTAGYSYVWFDPQGTADSAYSLEAIDLDGNSDWVGPVNPLVRPSTGRERKASRSERAMLLSEIGRDRTDQSISSVNSWPAAMKLSSGDTKTTNTNNLTDSSAEPLQIQRSIAAGTAVKIHVRKSGWYRVTQAELVAAGFDPSSDARILQLLVDGEEVPISLSTDGARLGANDTLEFYGEPLDTPTTDTRVYWLISGSSSGKRMIARRGKLKPAGLSEPVPESFDMTVERREKLVYFSSLNNGDAENIFGSPVRTEPVNQTLPIKNLDLESVSQPRLEVALQGLTAGDHQVQLKLNGAAVGTANYAHREHVVLTFPVSPSLLREGDNVVSLGSLNGQSDISLIDWVRLTYPRQQKADSNTLRLSVLGGQTVRIDGFTSNSVRVVDVTDPNNPTQLPAIVNRSGDNYSVKVQPFGSGTRTLLALTDDLMAHPSAITANQPSDWNAATNAADMVIITHKDFSQAIEPLANLRRSQGLSVVVVDVEDLYDEFSYGAHTPAAIRNFLMAASNWTRKPAYLLLVGDSSWDPRGYLNGTENDFVPTKLIDTQAMETGSDDWFADFNGAGIANMAIGRLPAGSVAEANLMVSKIIAYEQERALNAPLRGAVMVADRGFEEQSSQTWALLPFNVTVKTINRAEIGNDDLMRGQIVDALNQGPMIVNYYGHGSVRVWTGNGLLNSDLAANLTNNDRLSLFVMMTCLNGYASDANIDSLGEATLKAPNGGAVAVWASSGFTTPQPQFEMNREFYRLLFGGQPMRLGDAIRSAKAATSDIDVRRTWILLGDPAMRIR